MVCQPQAFVGKHAVDAPLSNWNGDVRFTASEYWEPASDPAVEPSNGLGNLVFAVASASANGKRLMTMGSTYAFEDLIRSDDWEISLRQLTRQLFYVTGFGGAALTDTWRQRLFDRNGSRRLVHVEAGIELGALCEMLDANPGEPWALPVLGGANKQTLAGAISTSTHGGDWQQPPLPDLVRAIHLVTDGGREVWLERASDPITTDGRLSPVLPCAGTEIIRDDEVFNAALVSFGRFGVVYSYVLEVTRGFNVVEVVTTADRELALDALAAGLTPPTSETPLAPLFALLAAPGFGPGIEVAAEATGDPYFCQLLFNSQDTTTCLAQRRWRTSNTVPLHMSQSDPFITKLFEGLALVLANVDWDLGLSASGLIQAGYDIQFKDAKSTGCRGPHHILTSGTREANQVLPPPANSIEVVFASNDTRFVTFLKAVLYAAATYRQLGYISVRPCAASRATLSMHNVDASHAYSVEVATLKGVPDEMTWISFVHFQATYFGGRPHWGQYNKLAPSGVDSLYGKWLRQWHRSLWRLTQDSGRFSSDFTRVRGLDPSNINIVTAAFRTPGGTLTHLVGPVGAAWSPVSVRDVIENIRGHNALYAVEAGARIAFIVVVNNPKVGGAYLRTEADGESGDNLAALPLAAGASPALVDDASADVECPLSVTSGSVGQARVTMLNTGTDVWERGDCVLVPTAMASIRFTPLPLTQRTGPYQAAVFAVPIVGGAAGTHATLACQLEKNGRLFGDASDSHTVVFTAVGEPAECSGIRDAIAADEQRIAMLQDALDPEGDPKTQAHIRFEIMQFQNAIANLRLKGTGLGCSLA